VEGMPIMFNIKYALPADLVRIAGLGIIRGQNAIKQSLKCRDRKVMLEAINMYRQLFEEMSVDGVH
jgi:hypothetical protein